MHNVLHAHRSCVGVALCSGRASRRGLNYPVFTFTYKMLQDGLTILFYFMAFVNKKSIIPLSSPAPASRTAHTVAILPQYYCAIFDYPPTPHLHSIRHATLCLAISSCKGSINNL